MNKDRRPVLSQDETNVLVMLFHLLFTVSVVDIRVPPVQNLEKRKSKIQGSCY